MDTLRLSVIIVNYNVKYFLEQCLNSLKRALEEIPHEIIVIDNNSSDGSAEYINKKFSQLTWIQNRENIGFSKANNQGIETGQGDYLLLLNPDTLINEDTFKISFDLIKELNHLGALGVKMIDGSGQFLPESKRGLPTPFVAFTRFSGLAKLFDKSKFLNRYYLGYLDPEGTHEVDVLCGAFMLIPREVINKVGPLDEDFFMYGEDIDLSYRIQQAGYKIYYTGKTSIIHYKGESTKKESFDYVKTFNNAMLIFAKKHFSAQKAKWYKIVIVIGIYLRAATSLISQVVQKLKNPLFDFLIIATLLWLQKELWENVYYQNDHYYPDSYEWINIPFYAFIWTMAIHFPKKQTYFNQLKYIGIATLILFAIYGLLPLDYRPSRFLIILGVVTISLYTRLKSWVMDRILNVSNANKPNLLIVGDSENANRILQNLEYAGVDFNYSGYLSQSQKQDFHWIGYIDDLPFKVNDLSIDEIIFSSESLSFQQITQWMSKLGSDISYRIAGDDASGIIGSISKNTSGQLYTFDAKYRVQDPYVLFMKRWTDIVCTLLLMIFSPIVIWFVQEKLKFFPNCWDVLLGRNSWVSYHRNDPNLDKLPILKQGILNPIMRYDYKLHKSQLIHKMNQLYAKEYTPVKDVKLIFGSVKFLGNSST